MARALLNDTANYPLPNRNVPGGVTGNFVGETLLKIRGHQGDVRVDWNASASDKFFARYSFATYEDARDVNPFPLVLLDAQRPAVLERRRQLEPHLRADHGQRAAGRLTATPACCRRPTTGPGLGAGNARYGIAGGQPIDGLSELVLGSGLTTPGLRALDSETLATTFQINEKLTWLKGRHTLKFGGQWLHYDQQRFYAGNNGLLGFFTYTGAFTGNSFADFLLDMAANKGRGGGDPDGSVDAPAEPHRRVRAGRLQAARQLDAERRPALGLHLAAGRAGQPADELRPGDRPADRRQRRQHRGSRALPAVLRRLRAAPRRGVDRSATAGWCAAATASRSSWRAPAPTCGCRSIRRSSSSRR